MKSKQSLLQKIRRSGSQTMNGIALSQKSITSIFSKATSLIKLNQSSPYPHLSLNPLGGNTIY